MKGFVIQDATHFYTFGYDDGSTYKQAFIESQYSAQNCDNAPTLSSSTASSSDVSVTQTITTFTPSLRNFNNMAITITSSDLD